jgi:antitoxin CptB
MPERNKLRWQCRRGALELDFILNRYLDNGYLHASEAEQRQFDNLLKLEDSVLINFLLGDVVPEDASLKNLILNIKNLAKN